MASNFTVVMPKESNVRYCDVKKSWVRITDEVRLDSKLNTDPKKDQKKK